MFDFDKMIQDVLETTESLSKARVLLNATTNLADPDLNDPALLSLKSAYAKTNKDNRFAWTVLNAIITQKKMFFCLTRDSLRDLIKNDVNHTDENRSFSERDYKAYLKQLTGITDVHQPGQGRQAMVLKVTDGQLLAYFESLGVDGEKQLAEAITFVETKPDESAETTIALKPSGNASPIQSNAINALAKPVKAEPGNKFVRKVLRPVRDAIADLRKDEVIDEDVESKYGEDRNTAWLFFDDEFHIAIDKNEGKRGWSFYPFFDQNSVNADKKHSDDYIQGILKLIKRIVQDLEASLPNSYMDRDQWKEFQISLPKKTAVMAEPTTEAVEVPTVIEKTSTAPEIQDSSVGEHTSEERIEIKMPPVLEDFYNFLPDLQIRVGFESFEYVPGSNGSMARIDLYVGEGIICTLNERNHLFLRSTDCFDVDPSLKISQSTFDMASMIYNIVVKEKRPKHFERYYWTMLEKQVEDCQQLDLEGVSGTAPSPKKPTANWLETGRLYDFDSTADQDIEQPQ